MNYTRSEITVKNLDKKLINKIKSVCLKLWNVARIFSVLEVRNVDWVLRKYIITKSNLADASVLGGNSLEKNLQLS